MTERGRKMRINKRLIVIAAAVVLVAAGSFAAITIIGPGEGGNQVQADIYYTCPMHPSIISDKPGDCPICGMSLVPRRQSSTGGMEMSESAIAGLVDVAISPTQRVLANVSTSVAEIRTLEKKITTVGRFDVDEQRLVRVAAWIGGRVEKLYVDFTGDVVHQGQPLLEIYSPALIQTQEEYLSTLRDPDGLQTWSEVFQKAQERLRAGARERLLLWGITETQITELEQTRKARTTTTIYAPASGTVLKKMVQEGQYVQQGQTLYDIADLSNLWMYANIYEYELSFLEMGQEILVTTEAHPGRIFRGHITFIDPVVQSRTRSVEIRARFPNPDGSLRPQMFGWAVLHAPVKTSLVVPVSAVVNTGYHQIVWEEVENNRFSPRNVTLGLRIGDFYQILDGLEEGAHVASSGGFLLDSESQLKAMAGGAMARMQHDDSGGM